MNKCQACGAWKTKEHIISGGKKITVEYCTVCFSSVQEYSKYTGDILRNVK